MRVLNFRRSKCYTPHTTGDLNIINSKLNIGLTLNSGSKNIFPRVRIRMLCQQIKYHITDSG